MAGLALKQNQPELALKILEGETTYVTMRHIKLLAWAKLGQFDNVFKMFRSILRRQQDEKKYEPHTSIAVVSFGIFFFLFYFQSKTRNVIFIEILFPLIAQ